MSNRRFQPGQVLLFLVTAALVIPLDQLSQLWITNLWKAGVLPLGSGFFRITYGQNTGAAFGMFQDARLVLSIISAIGILVILFLELFLSWRYTFLRWKSTQVALGLVLGGTFGNFIDRVFIGYVTDFIAVGGWPDFNIADSAVVVGGLLLAFNLIRLPRVEHPDEQGSSSESR